MKRLQYLDYLRGISAFGIMIYHYTGWSLGEMGATAFLGRVGIYGVAIFYCISGLTLFHVYEANMEGLKDVRKFFIRRIFRIIPLLWLSILATIIIYRPDPPISAETLFLNLSGLFSILKWEDSITIGAWSIGNELCFYLFFPVLVFLSRNSKAGLFAFCLLLLGVFTYFAFVILSTDKTIDAQWRDYVNPLNQAFLFAAGFLLGKLFQKVQFPNAYWPIGLLLAGVGLFVLYPVSGDAIHLVAGSTRIVFTISCLLICLGAYKLSHSAPKFIDWPLTRLGEASYSIYLLHPMMYHLTTLFYLHVMKYPLSIQYGVSVLLSLFGGHLIYRYLEKYFIGLGKRLS